MQRRRVEIRRRGRSGSVRFPTQGRLSGNCRCTTSDAVTPEPAHSGDPVQPDTAGLSLLRVPHPHSPMVSSRRPGLPHRGHLPHRSHSHKYSARPGNFKGSKLGESWHISWVNPLIVQRRKSRPREGQRLARATHWLEAGPPRMRASQP